MVSSDSCKKKPTSLSSNHGKAVGERSIWGPLPFFPFNLPEIKPFSNGNYIIIIIFLKKSLGKFIISLSFHPRSLSFSFCFPSFFPFKPGKSRRRFKGSDLLKKRSQNWRDVLFIRYLLAGGKAKKREESGDAVCFKSLSLRPRRCFPPPAPSFKWFSRAVGKNQNPISSRRHQKPMKLSSGNNNNNNEKLSFYLDA